MKREITNRESIYEYYSKVIYPKIKNLRGATQTKKLLAQLAGRDGFSGVKTYWDNRYRTGGNSGDGSYGKLAEYKAEILNDFVEQKGIQSLIEFGCGDGNQLEIAKYPKYIGMDISYESVKICKRKFSNDKSKSFFIYDHECFVNNEALTAELGLSLDVIYHLVEDEIFEKHIEHLFQSSEEYVIIYSSNEEPGDSARHVKHREFTTYIEENIEAWELKKKIENKHQDESPSDFYIYQKL